MKIVKKKGEKGKEERRGQTNKEQQKKKEGR